MSSNRFLSRLSFRRKTSRSSIPDPSLPGDGSEGAKKESALDKRGALGLNLLYDPPHPDVVFVFVHGLGGGSRKTWSKTAASTHYWPKAWLPIEAAFSQVQILSYGYDSDWAKSRRNVLSILHFSKAFLADLNTSPYLQNKQAPIVLIGHSMGGCIIKKMYMLAKHDSSLLPLVQRIHTIVFLATPHRGADLAKVLKHVWPVPRSYVKDLQRCSEALQTINDEFRHYSGDVGLWSFYETQKLGKLGALVVAVDSATLGYREEKQIPMTADHRSICKFDGPDDPNYVIVRNWLATIVSDIQNAGSAPETAQKNRDALRDQMNRLRTYLAVKSLPDDDLVMVTEARIAGTCEWLSARKGFIDWSNFNSDSASLLWMNGKPAAGKSVLAGYAVDQIQNSDAKCSYFFFKHGDKSKSRLSACLRSLAFQMACHNDQVRTALVQLQDDDIRFDKDNDRDTWRTLFLSTIFQIDFGHHFWIIDALDECADALSFFDSMLLNLGITFPLRILIVSRDSPELERMFDSLGQHRVQRETITTDDTLNDLRLLIETRGKYLTFIKDDERGMIVNKVIEKSSGSFLWTVLVMNELTSAHSRKRVQEILEETPRGMEHLYRRALELMSRFPRNQARIKAILRWATCTFRPLTVQELNGVLELEFGDSFFQLAESIHTLCCQLVVVDRFGKVQLIHETARQFLLDENLQSEFAIRKTEACSEIARVCLKYLTSDDLKPPRNGRRSSVLAINKTRNEFFNYACFAFADHLIQADPQASDILGLVEKFLNSNVLSWIEAVAHAQDLDLLIRTSRRLKTYSNAVAACRSPISQQFDIIQGWAVDLVRVAARFGDALVSCPWSIYSLIAPFCPPTSPISVSSATVPSRKIDVIGVSLTQWDDQLLSISFQGQTSAIGHGDNLFAVGLMNGNIAIYHADSCREHKILDHGDAVKFVQFKLRTSLMASCGVKTVKVWDVRTGDILHTFDAPPSSIGMVFDDYYLMVASRKRYIAFWDLALPAERSFRQFWRDSHEDQSTSRPLPCAVSISAGHRMLAAGYVNGPVTLWDMAADEFHGTCCVTMPHGGVNAHRVMALVLNPNPDFDLLAVSYLDGMLVLLNPYEDKILSTFRANCLTLASSSNGQLLAADAGRGLIQIYSFGCLQLLYQVQTANSHIKNLAFSQDHLRLIDIRGSHCNIWEPPVLLRETVSDDYRELSSWPMIEGTASDSTVKITSLCSYPGGKIVFCGRDDGLVSTYSIETGLCQETLYQHKSRVRTVMFWPDNNILMSVDNANVLFVWRMDKTDSYCPKANKVAFQSHMDCKGSISQVLLGAHSGKFILSTMNADYLHAMDGKREKETMRSQLHGTRQWINDPQNTSRAICVDNMTIDIYSWDDLTKLASFPLIGGLAGSELRGVRNCELEGQSYLLLNFSSLDRPATTGHLQLYDITPPNMDCSTDTQSSHRANQAMEHKPRLVHEQLLAILAPVCCHVIGLTDSGRLVFLDVNSWVCSASLMVTGKPQASYRRHFFVPRDWFSSTTTVIGDVWREDVIFAHNADVAIVKRGLRLFEEIYLS